MLAEIVILQITCTQMRVIQDICKVNQGKLFQTSLYIFITPILIKKCLYAITSNGKKKLILVN
jgi:hypothetical protein